jgi:hypothetical protein
MSANSLKDAIALFDQNNPLAQLDPTVGDPRLMAGRSAHKAAGLQALAKAKQDYRYALKANAIFIAPQSEEGFDKEALLGAAAKMGMYVIDIDDAYRKFANTAWRSMGSRPGNLTSLQVGAIRDEIDPVMEDNNIRSVTEFSLTAADSYASSFEDLANKVRRIVRTWAGSLFEQIYVEERLFELAWADRYDRAIVPVLLMGDLSALEISQLGDHATATLSVSTTEQDALEILTAIGKEVVSKRSPQSQTNKKHKSNSQTNH